MWHVSGQPDVKSSYRKPCFLFCHQHSSNPDRWSVTGEAFPVMRLLQRNPFIQQTSVKTCCVPGLGTWTSKIIKHNHPHFSWHCGSLILFMACLILSSNDEHLVSIIYVIIHRPFFFFAQKSVPRGSSRTDLLGFSPISRCVSIFRRVTRPLEPNLTWFDYRNLS